jgi:hypothetical protein
LKTLLNATDAVNGLGPSAYVGAGGFIKSKVVLTAGAAIGNIETRVGHNCSAESAQQSDYIVLAAQLVVEWPYWTKRAALRV